uniref:MEMO1 family protein ENV82_02470 n=1 Tax=Caldisericum exile TaxID=693075 RepID=A0A7C4TXR5_9BACT
MTMKIREAAAQGTFYPEDREELKSLIRRYVENAPLEELPGLKAIISPHAGYAYSGPVAGMSFKQLMNIDYLKLIKVIILAPSHFALFRGASVGLFDAYKTPLGFVNVSKEAQKLLSFEDFHFILEAHLEEHSIEVQLPFLQYILPHFEIVPILYSEIEPQSLLKGVESILDKRSILVVSTDLSHYYPYEVARNIDANCIKSVEKLDTKLLKKCEACGKIGIETIIEFANAYGLKSKVLAYATSGDTAGPKSQVVGYLSAVFYGGNS